MLKLLTYAIAVAAAMPAVAQTGPTDPIPFANTIKIEPTDSRDDIVAKAAHVVPNERQMQALDREFIAFVHWGPNAFSVREWGTGMEDPRVFAPDTINTDQWVKAMKDAGMKMVIITAKHHDGFVLWQSRYTDHGIMSSDYAGGKADVMRQLSESCKKYGLQLGIYLSPADLYQIESPTGLYGNLSPKTTRTIPREVPGRPFENKTKFTFDGIDDYNEYFLNQLFELLTEYGPIHEVWFDGAHPKQKGGQTYNYAAWKELIHTLAPEAVVFGREDIRWCGNEAGETRDTEWNVVTYQVNPDTLTKFYDMTDQDLGSRDVLYKGKYLHYQPAETDVSIRNGWFYRDDTNQQVRSADDVFDMYERSAGGNAILLLNIPPNRQGTFSQRDVDVLREVGQRIRDTYTTNLLTGNLAQGPAELFDADIATAVAAAEPIVITLKKPVTINRIVLQEPVATRGERVEDHAVDVWVNGRWMQIANATNIGHKRILRFPDVTTDRLRIRVGSSRLEPSLAEVGAYHYKAHAPELTASRDAKGLVTIAPRRDNFGANAGAAINAGYVIHYTTDGTTPTAASPVYTEPFSVDNRTVKAISVLGTDHSPVMEQPFGYQKQDWTTVLTPSLSEKHPASAAIDASPRTFWASDTIPGAAITIDLAKPHTIKGFAYTPQTQARGEGMIARGELQVSNDGKKWRTVDTFEFGNLINDPTTRYEWLKKPVSARYVRLVALEIAGASKVAAVAEFDLF